MNFELQILGSGSAVPTKKRLFSAQILTVYNQPYLIDCGEATQIQMWKYNTKFSKINNIFISHLHGDHFFGLFGLLSTYNLLGRKKTLNIYAHKKLEMILENEYSPLNIKEFSYKINFVHLSDKVEVIYENNNLKVTSFPLLHGLETCGFAEVSYAYRSPPHRWFRNNHQSHD